MLIDCSVVDREMARDESRAAAKPENGNSQALISLYFGAR
jgi:hypothetical protein